MRVGGCGTVAKETGEGRGGGDRILEMVQQNRQQRQRRAEEKERINPRERESRKPQNQAKDEQVRSPTQLYQFILLSLKIGADIAAGNTFLL